MNWGRGNKIVMTFIVLSQCLPGVAKENHENHGQGSLLLDCEWNLGPFKCERIFALFVEVQYLWTVLDIMHLMIRFIFTLFLEIWNMSFAVVIFIILLQVAYNQYASNCWSNLLLSCIRESTHYWTWIWVTTALFPASSGPD